MRNQGLVVTLSIIALYLVIWQLFFSDLPLHVSAMITLAEIMVGVWLGKRMASRR